MTGVIDRRRAIQQLGVAAATVAGGRWPAWRAGAPVTPGLQLYTVRTEMERSVERTLARVAEIGYREVEFAGYFQKTPAEIAALLTTNGLRAPAAHVSRAPLGDGWNRVLDDAASVGHQWVVIASVPPQDRESREGYRRLAEEFNRRAVAARQRGLRFAYHNHDYEFASHGDTHGHAVLLAECDPGLVHFELDLYWISRAGQDAATYVRQHPGRFPLVHVKDMASDGRMTEVGAGTIAFQRIFEAAAGGIQHFFVEHDQPTSPFDSITASFNALRTMTR